MYSVLVFVAVDVKPLLLGQVLSIKDNCVSISLYSSTMRLTLMLLTTSGKHIKLGIKILISYQEKIFICFLSDRQISSKAFDLDSYAGPLQQYFDPKNALVFVWPLTKLNFSGHDAHES